MEQFVYSNEGRVLLREATPEDALKIYDMYQDSTEKTWWKEKETSQFRYDLIEKVNGRMFVAVLDEEVIGHIEVIVPDDMSRPVYLVRLEIHDDYRRRKFGIELVRFSAIIMKNLGYESYVTWPNPDKSKGLYKKVGLKEIEHNPELIVNVLSKEEVEVEKIQELRIDQQPLDLEIVVGCSWAPNYTWLKAFEAAENEFLDYEGPYIHQVESNGTTGVILIDGNGLYIYVPEEKTRDVELIKNLLTYASNLAFEKEITSLEMNLPQEIAAEIRLDHLWEVEKEEERLEMKMEFE
ncbi:MAG: GNAT family N-acetyltransferase [Bacillota bacterium]